MPSGDGGGAVTGCGDCSCVACGACSPVVDTGASGESVTAVTECSADGALSVTVPSGDGDAVKSVCSVVIIFPSCS